MKITTDGTQPNYRSKQWETIWRFITKLTKRILATTLTDYKEERFQMPNHTGNKPADIQK